MSDYQTEVGITRDRMSAMLLNNDEQLAYVICEALACFADLQPVIDLGELGPDAALDPKAVVDHLRTIADAIENGEIS